ncbi:MAG: type I-U CRISPR-associated helicase/endonuclease Cas3 [Haliangiales bacterium]
MTGGAIDASSVRALLASALGLPADLSPFPWQYALLERLCEGAPPDALDIPTGLGKTATIAIWLLARAAGAPVPRRLVYVVDRRAVVDQATEVALTLRDWVAEHPDVADALGLEGRPLPISTLRGQFVDNREWLEDPARPAIIIGTIDMVGSRLLFEGYGASRKMRPYFAGLLGCDCLYALDESHLVPPFEALIRQVASWHDTHNAPAIIPRSWLMSLSATGGHELPGETGNEARGRLLRLTDEDTAHPEVARRLNAVKRLTLRELTDQQSMIDAMVEEAWSIVAGRPRRCIIFISSRADAEKVAAGLRARLADCPDNERGEVELFTGGRRVFERQQAANTLGAMGFLAGSAGSKNPSFLVATSAGEVGVDLDADDMVADLVAWERMVQRLGRVNRRGRGEASVTVFESPPADKEDPLERQKRHARRAAIEALPHTDGVFDGSPAAIVATVERADAALRETLRLASTEPPLYPPLDRPTLEAWSMTSLRDHTGRPEVAPWLRGWVQDEPQTRLVWRSMLPAAPQERPTEENLKRYIAAAPPHARERLEVSTAQVSEWLQARVKRVLKASKQRAETSKQTADQAPPTIVILNQANEIEAIHTIEPNSEDSQQTQGQSLATMDKNRRTRALRDRTLLLFGIGGLADSGMLDAKVDDEPAMADTEPAWSGVEDESAPPVPPFRVRRLSDANHTSSGNWRPSERIAIAENDDGESAWFVVEKWRDADAHEEARSVAKTSQSLEHHQMWAEERATYIANRLGLPAKFAQTLAIAARWHDQGKEAARWQRAFSAPPAEQPLAKTPGPFRATLLGGYRHELGSLLRAEVWSGLDALDEMQRQLALHLVAAHHGYARPLIGTDGCDDAPPTVLEKITREIALRFVRLQETWTPWGLAWLEVLLRAADQQASRRLEEAGDDKEGDEP